MDVGATPAVLVGPDGRLDVFARTPDGSLQHWWGDRGGWETENLGGSLGSAPAATLLPDGRLRVCAVSDAGALWHWTGGTGRWEAAELGGPVAGRPAIGSSAVFVRGADGALQAWRWQGDGWSGRESLGGLLASDPVRLRDGMVAQGIYHPLLYWPDSSQSSAPPTELAARPPYVLVTAHPPAAAWYGDRFDVFSCPDRGPLSKHSWDGARWWRDDLGGEVTLAPAAVSGRADRMDVFARGTAGALLHWIWDSSGEPDGLISSGYGYAWQGPNNEGGGLASAPAAVARDDDVIDVFCRGADGALHHWRSGWQEPLPEAPPPAAPPAEPQLLVVRPDDLVVLGVRYRGMELVGDDPEAGAPVLVASGDDARLIVTFPPQHLAEETLPAAAGSAELVGFRARGWLAGPSWLVFTVDPATRVVLTAEGVLAAMSQGRILPATGETAAGADEAGETGVGPDETTIELPWRLRFSPEPRAGEGQVGCTHPVTPVVPGSGTVGLWHTRLRGTGGPAGAGRDRDAGLALRPVDPGLAGTPDGGWSPPLSRAGRSSVVRYGQLHPPAAGRLALSTLGGSLSARGDWDRFSWEHETHLGRDHRVEVQWQGVLYPLGHRAVYQETTERVFADPDGSGSVAALRKRYTLTCTEPVRTAPEDPRLRRAFPFHRVEITRTVLELPGEPGWVYHPRPRPPVAASLQARRLAYLDTAIEELKGAVMTALVSTGEPEAERLAAGLLLVHFIPTGGELADVDQIAGSLGPWRDRLPPVDRLVELLFERRRVRQERLEPVPLGLFFSRSLPPDATEVRLPVHCTGPSGELRFTLPLIFVADHRLEPYGDLPGLHSLTDPEVQRLVAGAYRARGEVRLPGVPVDLVGSADRREADVHEVHGIRIEGPDPDGRDPWPGSGDVRPRLARVDVQLPALRTLVDHSGPVSLTFADDYLDNGEQEDLALLLAEQLPVRFTDHAERCGALLAPDFAAGAISRQHGPVNLAGARSLDPADLFDERATLLGFELRSIVDRAQLAAPPSIVFTSVRGQPSPVHMTWTEVALADHGPFRASNGGQPATLDLAVTIGATPAETVTRCTITSFTLVMPLLTLRFDQVTFTQRPGQDPQLELAGPVAEFGGELRLLQKLAGAVGLGAARPDLDVTSNGIIARYALPVPDLATGAFALRNLVFHAAIEVPFRPRPERPVSVTLGFASREEPFGLSVLIFGGGGHMRVRLDHRGVRELEIALEFGAMAAVNFGIAAAEVAAVGGVLIALDEDGPRVTGYLRFHGSVRLFGLVSVTLDVRVELTYDGDSNELSGRATLVLEVDLTLFSERVELDTGVWRIAGGGGGSRQRALDQDAGAAGRPGRPAELDEASWRRYQRSFAPREGVG